MRFLSLLFSALAISVTPESWGANTLSKEQLAALLLLLQPKAGEYEILSQSFDLDPGTPLIYTATTSDGLSSKVYGVQNNDGRISSLTGVSITTDSGYESANIAINNAYQITKIDTAFGTMEFFYNDQGLITSSKLTPIAGDPIILQAKAARLESMQTLSNSATQVSPVAATSRAALSCELDKLFDIRDINGRISFDCSSGYYLGTRYEGGNTILGKDQINLSAEIFVDDDGQKRKVWAEQTIETPITTKRLFSASGNNFPRNDWDFWFQNQSHPNSPSVINAPNYTNTSISRVGYGYSLRVPAPTKFPSYDEFTLCCNESKYFLEKANDKVLGLSLQQASLWIKDWKNQLDSSITNPTSCVKLPNNIISAALAAKCLSKASDLSAKYMDAVTFAKKDGDACNKVVYDLRKQAFDEISSGPFYVKPTLSNTEHTWTSSSAPFSEINFNDNSIEHFNFGGEPPELQPLHLSYSTDDPDQPDVEIQCDPKAPGSATNLPAGTSITMKKVDQFHDQQYASGCPISPSTYAGPNPFSDGSKTVYGFPSKSTCDNTSRDERIISSQHDSCAAYNWTLTKNGQAFQTSMGEEWSADDLEPGSYRVVLEASNSVPSRTNKASQSSLETAQMQCRFTIDADDEAIRQHMVGTWDVYDDFWVYSDGPYADGTRGPCAPRVDDVFVQNYNVPDGVTADIYVTSYRSYRITLNEGGTAILRYWNDSVDCGTKSEPDATTYSTSWQVQGGVFYFRSTYSVADIYGEILSLEEQFEGMEFFRKDHVYPNEYGSRYRLHRVSNP